MAINQINGTPPVRASGLTPRVQNGGEERKPASVSQGPALADDEVSLTAESRCLRELQDGLLASREEPFDTARVNALRDAIAAGEYRIDNERLARKLLDFEQALEG